MRYLPIQPKDTTSGFTLLEILVVIIIVGILAGIMAPGWLAFMNRQRVGAARSDLYDLLQRAQTDARQQREDRVVEITDPTGPTVVYAGSAPGSAEERRLGNLEAGLVSVAGTASSVTFNYLGEPTGNVPFIFDLATVEGNARECVVITNLLGGLKKASGDDCNPGNW